MTAAAARGLPGHWFSANPDKAWAEKFYLGFIPLFFGYNALIQNMGWLDVGNFWHVTQNLLMWLPYCVLLPLLLRRRSGLPWWQSYWFKLNLYMFVYVFFATYFHTEYFFSTLGIRYRFPHVTLYLDSALLGPDESSALRNFEKVPIGMYFNAIAFFIIYHTGAVICMRRVRTLAPDAPRTLRWLLWALTVAATAYFFAWAETFLYVNSSARANVWYVDQARMLSLGSVCYALYFIVSFPNVFRLDEAAQGPRWPLSRCVIEASFVSMLVLLLLDGFTWLVGPIA